MSAQDQGPSPLGAGPLVLSVPSLVPHREPLDAAQIRAVVDAIAGAGSHGASIWTAHHDWWVAEGLPSEAYFEYHRERDVAMPVAEVIFDWLGLDRQAIAEVNRPIFDVAARAGASTVIAVHLDPALPPVAEVGKDLAALCDVAADHGLTISLEFVPGTGVPRIAVAAQLLEATDRDNLGLCFDLWHWTRQPGGPDLATLRSIPGDRFYVLQLDDAPAESTEDVFVEMANSRLLPGEGDVDVQGVLGELADLGATPFIACEAFAAPRLAAVGVDEYARMQFAAGTAALERHRATRDGTAPHAGASA